MNTAIFTVFGKLKDKALRTAAVKVLQEGFMDRYVCSVCGYVYDPEQGDPDNGVEPGTAFENVPDSWTCPICGASKSDFEKE